MGKRDSRIDIYINNKIEDFAKPIMVHLRELIHTTCPEVEETWKWSFPHFMYHGAILCSMAAFKKHCAFNLWKASLIEDSSNLLVLQNRTAMGQLGKIESISDLPTDTDMKKLLLAAMKLNEQGVKLPARSKVPETEKKEYTLPTYFKETLDENPTAKELFYAFSYSHKKEYIEWFEEAKTETTRNKRIAQALEWIVDGKSRHWKYKNQC